MKLLVVFAMLAGIVFSHPALSAPIVSGDGTESCQLGAALGDGSCQIVTITPHPLWQPAGVAQWISYADTGYGGQSLAPNHGHTPLFSVFEQITVPGPAVLTLDVWADDTAGVSLDGSSLAPLSGLAPNFSQHICAEGSLGCEPKENARFTAVLTAGQHQLEFEVYQVGSGITTLGNPFGLLYSGAVTPGTSIGVAETPVQAAVPVPPSLLLLTGAIAGYALLGRLGTAPRS